MNGVKCALCGKEFPGHGSCCDPCTLEWDIANCELSGMRMKWARELAALVGITPQAAIERAFKRHPDLAGAKLAKPKQKTGNTYRDPSGKDNE